MLQSARSTYVLLCTVVALWGCAGATPLRGLRASGDISQGITRSLRQEGQSVAEGAHYPHHKRQSCKYELFPRLRY